MREGRIVQQGDIAEVWAHPVDVETALFLGYARTLEGDAAAAVLRAAGLPPGAAVAMRRSALTVADDGPLRGAVVSARATPDQVRLVVDVAGVGEVDAVAVPGSHAGPGDQVTLAVEPSRLAVVGRA